jgi:hypothetical protein
VAPVMRQAESGARRMSCGAATLLVVKSGFAETVRR